MADARSNRGPWIIAIAILIAGVVVGALYFGSQDESDCAEWQARYRQAAPPDGSVGVFDYVNIGPLAALREDRPKGCAIPNLGGG